MLKEALVLQWCLGRAAEALLNSARGTDPFSACSVCVFCRWSPQAKLQPGSRVRNGLWWCSSAVGKPRTDWVQRLDHGSEIQRVEGRDFFLHTDSDNYTLLNHFGNHRYFSHISFLEFLFLVTFSQQQVLSFPHYCLLVWVTVQELGWEVEICFTGANFLFAAPFLSPLWLTSLILQPPGQHTVLSYGLCQ